MGSKARTLNNNMTKNWVQDPMGWVCVLYLKKYRSLCLRLCLRGRDPYAICEKTPFVSRSERRTLSWRRRWCRYVTLTPSSSWNRVISLFFPFFIERIFSLSRQLAPFWSADCFATRQFMRTDLWLKGQWHEISRGLFYFKRYRIFPRVKIFHILTL